MICGNDVDCFCFFLFLMSGPYSTTPAGGQCDDHFYSCEGGGCVYESWVCDGEPDCVRGDDENNCQSKYGVVVVVMVVVQDAAILLL